MGWSIDFPHQGYRTPLPPYQLLHHYPLQDISALSSPPCTLLFSPSNQSCRGRGNDSCHLPLECMIHMNIHWHPGECLVSEKHQMFLINSCDGWSSFLHAPSSLFFKQIIGRDKIFKNEKKKEEENGSNPITPRSDQEVIYPQIVNSNHWCYSFI